MQLKKTPLNEIHRKYGGRMVDFAGWEMPVQYAGALKEHLAVRQAVGVFDVSHMGEIEITGKDAVSFVQRVTTNDASRLSENQAQYSCFLYPEGTFVDDIVVYRLAPSHFLICVNAANKDKDFEWLQSQREGEVEIVDRSSEYVQLAVQGPASAGVIQSMTETDLGAIRTYWFARGRVAGVEALISRTGYTGEDGFELYFPPEHAERVWETLFRTGESAGIVPCGLAARNTLRLEMKYALYGHDIDNSTTPLEAGLGWIVKLDKGPFVGRDALLRQKEAGVSRKLVGFELLDPGIARDHYPVWIADQQVSEVTSGSYGPSIQKSIGMLYLPTQFATIGQRFEVDVRGKRLQAQVVSTPFYKRA